MERKQKRKIGQKVETPQTVTKTISAMESTLQENLLQEPVEPVAVAPAVVENAQPVAETTETAPLVQKQEDDANASVGASIINMTNNVLGSGLVALAYAVRNCSLIPGVLTLITLAGIACFSQIVITRSVRITNKYTYKEMGAAIFGSTGGTLISCLMLCYTCGSCISYFVIIGDLFLDAFKFFFPTVALLQSRALVVGTICFLCVFPLCMMKTVDALRYVSVLSIMSILVTVGVVFFEFASHPVVDPTVEIWHITPRYLLALPIMCVSFNCHYNVPRYYYELKNRSPGRMWMTSIGATCIILFLYLVVSLSGYLKFGIHTEGNILNSYPEESVWPTIARVGLGLGIICHFPIAYFAVRTNLHSLFCQLKEFHSFKLRLVTALSVLTAAVTVAILCTKVEVVLGFNGSLFGTLIMFAVPGMMYLKATKGEQGLGRKKCDAWFMAIFGFTMCIVGTTITTLKVLKIVS